MTLTRRSEAVTSLGGHAGLLALMTPTSDTGCSQLQHLSSECGGEGNLIVRSWNADARTRDSLVGCVPNYSSERQPHSSSASRDARAAGPAPAQKLSGRPYLPRGRLRHGSIGAADRCGRDASRSGARRRCSHHRVSRRLIGLLAIRPSTRFHAGDFRAYPDQHQWADWAGRHRALAGSAPAPSGVRSP